MIEFQSKKPKLSISLDGAVEVTFTAPRAKLEALTNLSDKDFDITVKQHREKRSLDANAYAWVLITAIADELRASKDEIYFDMLKKYGQGELISVKTGDIRLVIECPNKRKEQHLAKLMEILGENDDEDTEHSGDC